MACGGLPHFRPVLLAAVHGSPDVTHLAARSEHRFPTGGNGDDTQEGRYHRDCRHLHHGSRLLAVAWGL